MGQPAARLTDMHVCPMATPGTPPIPHVGGPITGPGCPTVLIGGMPAAVMGDMAVCTGPPDTIIKGSSGVMIGGKPAARVGDSCAHGGTITLGCMTVLIGETSPGSPPSAVVTPETKTATSSSPQATVMQAAAQRGTPFCEICEKAKQAEQQKAAKKTFIEVELVGPDGKPVPGAKYEIQLPDGSKKVGFLDTNGKARVDGVDPGSAQVRFPDYESK